MTNDFQIVYLANYPQYVPLLAEWMIQAWGRYNAHLTLFEANQLLRSRLNKTSLPYSLVALHGDQPVGMISLKEEEPGLSTASDKKLWEGSLYVIPEVQKLGLKERLHQEIEKEARRLGHSEIYVFVSDPESQDWHLKYGYELVENRMHLNHHVSVMRFFL